MDTNQLRAKARTFTAFNRNCMIINKFNDYAGLEGILRGLKSWHQHKKATGFNGLSCEI